MKPLKFLFMTLVLCFPMMTAAQPATIGEVVDEIEVVGRRLDELRLEMETARIEIYVIFNRLNVDAQFDMQCYRRKTTGSLIKERICVPRFVEDALEKSANSAFRERRGSSISPLSNGRVRTGNREMRDRMVELANAHPELQSAILDLQGLVDEYAEATDACEAGDC